MTRRYLFLCPDRTSASGGIAVIYDVVALLNKSGYSAAVVHNGPGAGYPDYPEPVPMFYTRTVWQTYWRHSGPKAKLKMARERVASMARQLQPLDLKSTDVIVAPEFQLAEAIEAFKGFPVVVFVQNPFALMMSYQRAVQRGMPPQSHVKYWLGIADVCRTHMSVLGLEPSAIFPVTMKPHEFPFQEKKQRLITYMPRKRPWEAAVISEALIRRNKILDYRIEALDNMPRSEVAAKLAESRFFISLLQLEALGFPAAEAMASGCIVIGFDGLGTAEYFDNTSGVPVTEGDVASVVESVERAVAEYETDPTRFDAMRSIASKRINERYSVEAFKSGVLDAWKKLDVHL